MMYEIEIQETCSYRRRMIVAADTPEAAAAIGEEEGCGPDDFVGVDARHVVIKRIMG